MPASQSRSPSPAAPPPVAATPGPRAAALQKLYSDALSHTLKTCNYANFASCFPTPAKNAEEDLQVFHSQFVERLDSQCREQFEMILRERNVIPALNDLDRLVDEARKRRAKAMEEANGGAVQAPVPPHTLPASSLYLSHLNPSLQEHESALTARLEGVQAENKDLLAHLLKQRKEIESLISGLENVVADLDGSLTAVPSDDMMALTEETVAVDEEMRMNS
ncbi:hypothetical protein M8818_006259 [Zalaria obscura]|uniref:Uncharacterized protein n=1 Tax=Zalaria obscura TaxID=2024903 RepID=A0ACC3S7D3_9PEZI